MKYRKLFVTLLISATCGNSWAQDESSQTVRQSAVFLEQIVGAWAIVLPKWDRDPSSDDWQKARANCSVAVSDFAPNTIEDASAAPPSPGHLYGNLIYYRGPDGLQQYDRSRNEARLFPELRVGKARNGSPVYQISGSGGQIVVTIGKVPSDQQPEIVLIRGSELYLKCSK